MKSVSKIMSVALAGAMVLSMAACGNGSPNSSAGAGTSNTAASKTADGTSFATMKLGIDDKDIKANLKFLTHRTDIVNTKFAGYVKDFQKLYPNVSIKYEAVTNYADDVTTRMSTKDWGDVCMIPTTVPNTELGDHFVSFGDVDTLSKTYKFTTNKSYQKQVYGISSTGNVQGIVYNKKVFKDAGITALPKTPTEFLTDLKTIKEKTKAIPLYTNFAAKWTMGAWDAYIGGCATGDGDFMNQKLAKMKDPFAKVSFADGTGPYAVYNVLYQAVSQGLTEDDPTTTDWESSKAKINNGQIATMALGSWAVTQAQQAGKHAADIGYMPFPITVNGQQYATMGSDYCYGINKNSSKDNQTAAMLYIKYLTEKSNFAYSEGEVPVVKGAELPSTLADFKNIKMVEDAPAKDGEEDLYTDVNNDSKLSLNSDNDHVMSIVQSAKKKDRTLDQIVAEWNKKWTAAQKSNDVKQS
ncbi:MAG: ABC transporter substrate-binding protein [Oscillospiraceae bacterium]|jgi:ABC-type glycerol-3-phosphate transport system substrate-binding protein|nr:ABC transporter substrate-binding protein [Oscillospiraceae bacterium]